MNAEVIWEWLSIIIAALALLVSLIVGIATIGVSLAALRRATKANSLADDANALADRSNRNSEDANRLAQELNRLVAGDAETAMSTTINAAWEKVHEVKVELEQITQHRAKSKWTAEDKRAITSKESSLRFAVERVLNLYESACGRYLDGTCNRERFKKIFHDEIRKFCQSDSPAIKGVLNLGPTSKFQAIMKVYDEWHNLET